jgi:hypothetical protein
VTGSGDANPCFPMTFSVVESGTYPGLAYIHADAGNYGPNGNDYTPALSALANWVEKSAVVASADVRSTTPRWTGATGGDLGTCQVPAAASVLKDVAVDAVVGTYWPAAATEVLSGVQFGPAGSLVGTLQTGGGGGGGGLTSDEHTALMAVKAQTDSLHFDGDNVLAKAVAVADKTGFALAAEGLDAIAVDAPTGPATSLRGMVVQLWRRFFRRAVLDTSAKTITTYADDGTTVLTTQPVDQTDATETQGAAV